MNFKLFGRGESDDKNVKAPSKGAKPQLEVIGKAGKPAEAIKGESARGVIPAAAPSAAKPSKPSLVKRETIKDYQHVPPNQGVLTVGAKAVERIPKDLEYQLAVLELGPKRAAVLYDPTVAHNPQFIAILTKLRATLLAGGWSFDEGGDHPCKSEVIKILVQDATARQGSNADPESVRSQAKERFLGWLETAVTQKASDLHVVIEGQGRALVQLRVNGELENLKDARGGVYSEVEAKDAMAWPYNSLVARGSNSDTTFNESKNAYCMTDPREVAGKKIALRYQLLRGSRGPKLVCRLLNVDQDAPAIPFEKLGFAPSQAQIYRDVGDMDCGLTILAGVTGSGKTTTVKTFLETHPKNGSAAFYSVEDPVEYHLRGVHQISLQRDTADAAGSRRLYQQQMSDLMRADPDLAFIGEIRDMASAGAAQSLVSTGHASMATLHAHLMSGIIRRLTDEEVGMNRGVLTGPTMLSLLSYQALVPTLCQECAVPMEGMFTELLAQEKAGTGRRGYLQAFQENMDVLEKNFKVDVSNLRFRNEAGCKACNGRGTSGQTVVAEMFMPDRPWLEFTREGQDHEAMQHYRLQGDGRFDSPDMTGKTVFEHTLYKALIGTVDVRNCERFTLIRRYQIKPDLKRSGFVGVSGLSDAAEH